MNNTPKEEQDQMALAELLDRLGLDFIHVPNEIKSKPQYYSKRRRLGVKKGFPDNLIFTVPPNFPGSKGAVIELKRLNGGVVSEEQNEWIAKLAIQGWEVAICRGIDDAIKQLEKWGYVNKRGN